MKFLKKLKSSNFWVSMISAAVLILQAVFNVEIKSEYLNQIIMAILGLLVMSGIVSDGGTEEVTVKQNTDVESVKNEVLNVVAEVASTFQTNLSGLIKQFTVIKENVMGTESAAHTNVKADENVIHDNAKVVENVSPINARVEDNCQKANCEDVIVETKSAAANESLTNQTNEQDSL